jgi:transcriptional regulator
MADMLPIEQIADAIFKMVKDAAGVKKYKAMDLQKAMMEMFPDRVDKQSFKASIKQLIDSGRLVYTYFGGSYIEVPHVEGAANPPAAG